MNSTTRYAKAEFWNETMAGWIRKTLLRTSEMDVVVGLMWQNDGCSKVR